MDSLFYLTISNLFYPKVTNFKPYSPIFLVNLLFSNSILGNSLSIKSLNPSVSQTGLLFNHKIFKSGSFTNYYFINSISLILLPYKLKTSQFIGILRVFGFSISLKSHSKISLNYFSSDYNPGIFFLVLKYFVILLNL